MFDHKTLSLFCSSAVLVGSVSVWSSIRARRLKGLPVVEAEPAYPASWTVIDVAIMLVLTLVINLALGAFATSRGWLPETLPKSASPAEMANAIFIFSVSSLVAMIISMVLVPLRTGATRGAMGFTSSGFVGQLKLGALAFLALALPVYLVQILLTLAWKGTTHPVVELLRDEPSPKFFLMSAFSAVLVAPIVEEFFFRVLFQRWLETAIHRQEFAKGVEAQQSTVEAPDHGGEQPILPEMPAARSTDENPYAFSGLSEPQTKVQRAAGDRIPNPSIWAVVISALMFAIAHSGNGPDPIPLFILALGLGYLYQRTRRILPCIVVHLLLNALSLSQLWLYVHME